MMRRMPQRQASPGEVVVRLPDPETTPVRVCVSPIASLLSVMFEALLDRPRGAPLAWYEHVRRRAGGHAEALAAVYDLGGRAFPEFVAPNPIAARATIEQELEALRTTPPAQALAEMREEWGDDPPPGYRPFHADPEAGLAALADRLGAVWSAVLAPHGATIEAILEREVLNLGAALVADGPPSLLARLPRRIDFDGAALRWHSATEGRELELEEGGLVLVPMVSGPDAMLSTNRPSAGSVIAYAAPGAAALWEAAELGPATGLTELLGDTRTRVMLVVATPATTADVAQQLDISPSLASHHLKALERIGLVSGARFGRRVYYRLAERGRRVRDAFA